VLERTGRKEQNPLVCRGREIAAVKEIEARETRTGRIGMLSEIGVGGETGSEIEPARRGESGSGSGKLEMVRGIVSGKGIEPEPETAAVMKRGGRMRAAPQSDIAAVKEIEARETRTGRIGMLSEIGVGGETGSEIEPARGGESGIGSGRE
jgi:hypothetical protein